MPVSKIECPECQTVLKPSKPVEPGKKVRCPKCSTVFPVTARDGSAKKPAPAAAKAAADDIPDVIPLKDEPAPARARAPEETYTFIQEQQSGNEKERKHAATGDVRDVFKKSKRGPALAACVAPSNWLLRTSFIWCLGHILGMLYWFFPLIFSEHLVNPLDVLKDSQGRDINTFHEDWSRYTPDEQIKLDEAEAEAFVHRIVGLVISFVCLLYSVFIVIGAVKMQNVESYPWAWVAAILMTPISLSTFFGGLAIIIMSLVSESDSLIGYFIGLVILLGSILPIVTIYKCYRVLLDSEVKAGFYEKRN